MIFVALSGLRRFREALAKFTESVSLTTCNIEVAGLGREPLLTPARPAVGVIASGSAASGAADASLLVLGRIDILPVTLAIEAHHITCSETECGRAGLD